MNRKFESSRQLNNFDLEFNKTEIDKRTSMPIKDATISYAIPEAEETSSLLQTQTDKSVSVTILEQGSHFHDIKDIVASNYEKSSESTIEIRSATEME